MLTGFYFKTDLASHSILTIIHSFEYQILLYKLIQKLDKYIFTRVKITLPSSIYKMCSKLINSDHRLELGRHTIAKYFNHSLLYSIPNEETFVDLETRL